MFCHKTQNEHNTRCTSAACLKKSGVPLLRQQETGNLIFRRLWVVKKSIVTTLGADLDNYIPEISKTCSEVKKCSCKGNYTACKCVGSYAVITKSILNNPQTTL